MVTMHDVARACGVSTTTVSNAFNRPDQLSPALRERILGRATAMGYLGPHLAGRALRGGTSNAYGVVFMDRLANAFEDEFKTRWLAGFSEALAPVGANLVLMNVPADRDAAANALRRTIVDGVAVTWAHHPIMQLAREHGLAVVASGMAGPSWVSVDEYAAGMAVAEHVRSLGRTRVAVIAGPCAQPAGSVHAMTWAEYLSEEQPHEPWERLHGVVEGLEGTLTTIIQAPRWSREAGREAAGLALRGPRRPTALVCLSDALAAGALDVLVERGLRAGRDVSVTGFDGTPLAAELGITTVDCHARDQGRASAELLLHPRARRRRVTVPHELVVRASSGAGR